MSGVSRKQQASSYCLPWRRSSILMEERHVEIIRAYKRGYGEGFERRRYPRLHGVRHELLDD
jgi:hypothetical protein